VVFRKGQWVGLEEYIALEKSEGPARVGWIQQENSPVSQPGQELSASRQGQGARIMASGDLRLDSAALQVPDREGVCPVKGGESPVAGQRHKSAVEVPSGLGLPARYGRGPGADIDARITSVTANDRE